MGLMPLIVVVVNLSNYLASDLINGLDLLSDFSVQI